MPVSPTIDEFVPVSAPDLVGPAPAENAVVVDIETYSELDLAKVGAYRYAMDPSTDVLCLSASFAIRGQHSQLSIPGPPFTWGQIHQTVFATSVTIQAFNDTFDRLIWKHILTPRYGWPDPDRWIWEDLAKRAAYANLPGNLDGVCRVLRTRGKDAEGHKLMMRLCKPARLIEGDNNPRRLHTPDALRRLSTYCNQDAACEAALDSKLPPILESEQAVIAADRRMNERGIRIDRNLVRDMMFIAKMYGERLTEELNDITRREVTATTQLPAMKRWLRERGLAVRDGPGALDKHAIDGFLNGEFYEVESNHALTLEPEVRRVLTIRREMSKSSLAKLDTLLAAADPTDDRVRGMFQYYGAEQTGRWAGRIIQPQNLPRGVLKGQRGYEIALDAIKRGGVEEMELLYGPRESGGVPQVMDVLSSCLRACLVPTPGNEFVVIDYNAIEARMAAWFADERWALDAYRSGIDVYKIMAGLIYSTSSTNVTESQRDDGKLAELSCQYGIGWKTLKKQAKQRGRVLTEEFARQIIDAYRDSHRAIVSLWGALEDGAKAAIRQPNMAIEVAKVAFKFDGVTLKMRLPSGRCIWFNQASVQMRPMPWDVADLRLKVCYLGEDSVTGQWTEQTAWGGDFMALATQGMARDLIAHALVRTDYFAWHPVLTSHDELGFDITAPDLREMNDAMCEVPSYFAGLPVAAKGYSTPFYRKG